MTSPFKHENVIKIAGVLGAQPELRLTANGNSVATLIVYTNYMVRNEDGSMARRASATAWCGGCTPRRQHGCCARAASCTFRAA